MMATLPKPMTSTLRVLSVVALLAYAASPAWGQERPTVAPERLAPHLRDCPPELSEAACRPLATPLPEGLSPEMPVGRAMEAPQPAARPLAAPASGSPGALDLTFGSGGTATLNIGSAVLYGHAVALQPDGKVIVAGYAYDGANINFALARYDARGTLDLTFGNGGLVTGPSGSAYDVALQADGKIVAAGSGGAGAAVVRYNVDGSLDTSFGTGGTTSTAIGGSLYAVALQPDGKIVTAGYSFNGVNSDFALVRFTASGALDPSFGAGGVVTTDFEGGSDAAYNVAVQADGRIVAAGGASTGSGVDFALARFTASGALDTSFGDDGVVTTDFEESTDSAYDVALQSDGQIIVAGYTFIASGFDFALARYTTSGALDTSFGTGGIATTNFGGSGDYAEAIALQSDGKVVVVGYADDGVSSIGFALARYTASGALDTSFGSGGTLTTDFDGGTDIAEGVAVQPDGRIVVAGYASVESGADFALARFTASGDLDTAYGDGGTVTTPNPGDGFDVAYSVAAQPDGKVVAAGYTFNGNDTDFALTRYTASGALDASFGDGGVVTTDVRLVTSGFGGGFDYARAVALQPDGKILVAGHGFGENSTDFVLARYTTSGALDASFGDGGVVTTDFAGSTDNAWAVAVQPDGRIVLAGHAYTGDSYDLALARYDASGALDLSFGDGGRTTTDFGGQTYLAFDMTLQEDGRIVVAGRTEDTSFMSDFALARYSASGALDTAFGTGGLVTTNFAGRDGATDVAVQPDGRIVVAGWGTDGNDFALARYDASGALDLSFGDSGRVVTDFAGSSDEALAMTLQPDGRIVAGGYAFSASGSLDFALARYTASGALDTSFGDGGLATTDFGDGTDWVLSLEAQPDGRIVAAGRAFTGGSDDIALARYEGGGTDDGPDAGSCAPGTALATLDASDVQAAVFNKGNLSRDPNLPGGYFVPLASGRSPLFAASVWVGGTVSGQERVAGATYGDFEFWPGPLGAGATLPETDCRRTNVNGREAWDRIYVVSTADLDAYAQSGTTTPDLEDWPVGLGAPTVDASGEPVIPQSRDQLIDLASGEQPVVYGSQTAFWVMNDVGNTHVSTGSEPLGIEVQVSAFAIADPENPALDQGTFYRHTVVNRSTASIDDAYLTLFADPDLGYYGDDYIGTDPARGMTFVYNADNEDENGYGTPPPAMGYDLLSGAASGMYGGNVGPDQPTGDPTNKTEYYNRMQGLWNDGSPITTGGTGYQSGGDVTPWTFPGAPEIEAFWSEVNTDEAGADNPTGDRRAYVSTGAFALQPGASQTVDLALLFAQGTTNLNSVAALKAASDDVQARYEDGSLFDTAGAGNQPPIASGDTATTLEAASVLIDVLANDSDPDGDPLTIAITSGPSSGSAEVEDDQILYMPEAGFTGTDAFTYAVSDGRGGTDEATVTVTITERPENAYLDPSFGTDGLVTTDFAGGYDGATSVAVLPDGRIIVAGWTESETDFDQDFALARYDASGALDPSFGDGGRVTTDFAGGEDLIAALVLQPDGKILAAGWAEGPSGDEDFALARYTASGALDPSFGDGGRVTTDFAGGYDDAYGLILQPDGKVVVAGWTESETDFNSAFALARYDASGALDPSFGDGGRVTTDFAGGYAEAFSLSLQPDGKILVAGTTYNVNEAHATSLPLGTRRPHRERAGSHKGGGESFALARYDASGELDPSFGDGGRVLTDFAGSYAAAYGLALQSDGRIVLAGYAEDGNDGSSMALARYDASGELDPSFGDGGRVLTNFGSGTEAYAFSLAILPGGQLLVAGGTEFDIGGDFALAQYDASGALDASFGDGGRITTDFGDDDYGYRLALQPDGNILVVGQTDRDIGDEDFALARYLGSDALANLPPVASGATATTPEGVSVLIDVLGGDTDPDGDTLTLEAVSVPAHGTAERESGQVRYTPAAGFVGEDAFSYTVSDGRGGTAEGPVTVTVTEVAVTASPEGPTRAGAPATIAVSVSGFTPTTARLHYRPGGATGGYASVPLASDASGYRASVPAEAVTLRGVDYYAELSDGERTMTFPAGAPEASPAHLRVTVAQQAVAASPPPDGSYRMVSIPVALQDASPEAVFADDYGTYGPAAWRVLRWNPSTSAYAEYPNLGTSLAPGVAVWLAAFGQEPFDIENGTSLDPSEPVVIRLQPGWNQIGSPFAFPVAWAAIEGSAAVDPPVARGDGEWFFEQSVLEPWSGYFVRNGTGAPVILTVPPVEAEASKRPGLAARASGANGSPEAAYRLRLEAVAPERGLRDTQNALGFAGDGARDLYEPPPIGEHLRLSVLGDADAPLAYSFREDTGAGATWEVEVTVTPGVLRAGPLAATLTLTEDHERPDGYEVYVFDAATGATVPVREGTAVLTLTERAPTRRLRVVVGTAAFAEDARGTPTEAALYAAYPNPASGAATIPYDLAETEHVVLEVFDALGRRIAVLADEEQAAGRYTARWDPRGVASGVYLYRLRAGAFVATQRVQVVR